jgi:hypothetical protein
MGPDSVKSAILFARFQHFAQPSAKTEAGGFAHTEETQIMDIGQIEQYNRCH